MSSDFRKIDKSGVKCVFQLQEQVYSLATSKSGNDDFVIAGISYFENKAGHPPMCQLDVAAALADPLLEQSRTPIAWAQKRDLVLPFESLAETVWCVSLSHDDTLVAAASQRDSCLIFDRASKKLLKEFSHDSPVRACALTPDGSGVVWSDWAGSLRFGRTDLPGTVEVAEFKEFEYSHTSLAFAVQQKPFNTLVASKQDEFGVYRWKLDADAGARDQPELVSSCKFDFGDSGCVDITPDATRILALREEGSAVLLDTESLLEVQEIRTRSKRYEGKCRDASICMNDTMAVFAVGHQTLLADLRSGKIVRSFVAADFNQPEVYSARALGDLQAVISGSKTGDISMFDVGMASMIKSSRKS